MVAPGFETATRFVLCPLQIIEGIAVTGEGVTGKVLILTGSCKSVKQPNWLICLTETVQVVLDEIVPQLTSASTGDIGIIVPEPLPPHVTDQGIYVFPDTAGTE